MPPLLIRWMASLFVTLLSLTGMAATIDVTLPTPIVLNDQLEVCAGDSRLSIEEVAGGACPFKPGNKANRVNGFTAQAFWLRLTLRNPTSSQSERWLRIGHPRLQRVTLFEATSGDGWRRTNTGTLTPASQRPILATYPVLPLMLEANETKTVYVRVASESLLDITATLWTPRSFANTQQRTDLSWAVSFGGLLVTCCLSALLFLRQHEWSYLFFAGMLIFSAIYDASYTGLLPTYLWPPDLPYEIRLQGFAIGVSTLFFVLFVRSFAGNTHRYFMNYAVMYSFAVLTVLVYLWAGLVNYRSAIQVSSLPIMATNLSGVVIFIRSWRDGSRAAGYILLSYSAILPLTFYRTTMEYGVIGYHSSQTSLLLAFMLVTPTILFGIAAHSEALSAALSLARADINARMTFLARMSHEFHTPLNTVLGYAELLQRGSSRVTLQEGVAAIKNASRHLLSMVDDILDQIRGESGQISLQPTPVHWNGFIQSLEQSASMMIERGNHFFVEQDGTMPDAVLVDEHRLHGVLSNLLSNANRYTRNGNITFNCTGMNVDGEHCRLSLSVSDTGQGISKDEQESIFRPFTRGMAGKSSGIDGIGLGLVIAQQLVTLMGGTIRVDSKPGHGSRFYFSIVCKIIQATPKLARASQYTTVLTTHTILLVEDDEIGRNLLAMLLADTGFNVIMAKSGNDARQFIGRHAVNLVITDQFMPDGDGWSVLKDWSAQNIPTILLSASPPDRPEGLPETLQFFGIQLKPVDTDTLLYAIGEILGAKWTDAKAQNYIGKTDIIQQPPIELLEPLKAMIEQGAVTDIAEWLEIFSAQYPQYSPYAAKIATANLALDFKELQRLTT
jgi:signal transduction histidine kinase/DNA-binding NarL/FixJ family response regulator